MIYALGIEIGGTKLQAGVGLREDKLISLARTTIQPETGAKGILSALPALCDDALKKAQCGWDDIVSIGVGFGGPVDSQKGIVLTSHQIEGWDRFPLKDWIENTFSKPAYIQNDASIAGYAEAHLGAGKGCDRVFYITIGSGIGGGWIVNGSIDEGQGLGAAEIGHIWVPDPETGEPEKLEHICSGWSIGQRMRDALELDEEESILREQFADDLSKITAKDVYLAAEQNDELATVILDETSKTLAVAICNIIALLHPQKIILGGGVSLMGDLFWNPLISTIEDNVFEPFAGKYEIVPAALEEEVVVAGAALLGLQQKINQ